MRRHFLQAALSVSWSGGCSSDISQQTTAHLRLHQGKVSRHISSTSLAMDPESSGPCYTCRNRRIQCDQTGVPCAKCQKAGLECLDKRPFRWVQGVAIRGRMQGRSYDANKEAAATAAGKRVVMKSNATRRGLRKAEGLFILGERRDKAPIYH